MQNNLLVFGTKNFNNSLHEIKDYLDFSLFFFNNDTVLDDQISTINALLVESAVCNDRRYLNLINSINNKPVLLIEKLGFLQKCNYTHKILSPFTLSDFNTMVVTFITSEKFTQNSFIKIKQYTVDKNEKKLSKDNLSITVTEREIYLIELLFNEKKPQSKTNLLKNIWKYSEDADTHTVETHIYRLRKKIFAKFNDENFIISSNSGYSI